MTLARGELVSLPELAIPYVRARSAIFDTAIWRRYQHARAGIRRTGENVPLGARLGGTPIPPKLGAAEEVRNAVVAEARADFSQRVLDGRLQVWGQPGSIRGIWQLIGLEELSYLKAVRGMRDRWEGGGLCYYRPHVLDRVGVESELAGRIYGPLDLVRHIDRLESDPGVDWVPGQRKPLVYQPGVFGRQSSKWDYGSAADVPYDPEAVAAEYRRALVELQAWVDVQLQSDHLNDAASGKDGQRRICPPFALPPHADDVGRQAAPHPIQQDHGANAPVEVAGPATPQFEEASDVNVRNWFEGRVATWADDRPYPSEDTDWEEFEKHFGPSMTRENFRTARRAHTPLQWRKQGPRKPRKKTR